MERRASRACAARLRALISMLLILGAPLRAAASPSTHVWTPSPDIQAHGTLHLTTDLYVPSENDAFGERPNTVADVGLTGGLWPVKDKFGIELGIDHITGYGDLDDYPLYFNAKAGVTEDALFDYSPSAAFGGYNFGTEDDKTDFNIWYFKAGRTVKVNGLSLGRFSAGYFWGEDSLLVDNNGEDSDGVMLTWERTMDEISDKLWICVDYQGTDSGVGALAPGFSWKFADNVSMIFGYVIPNNSDYAETFTVQLDIDQRIFE